MSDVKRERLQLIASGKPIREIAKTQDITESALSKLKTRNKELIEQYAQEYINALPSIVEQDIKELKSAPDISNDLLNLLKEESQIVESKDGKLVEVLQDKRINALQKYLEYIGKKQADIKRSIGMLPSHAPAQIYQQFNIYNDNRQTISNTVLNALTNNALNSTSLPDDIVIDVDVDE